jgi:subtilase family serine protease
MSHRPGRLIAAWVSLGVIWGVGSAIPAVADAASPAAPAVVQASSPIATPSSVVSATPPSTTIEFSVGLQLSDPAGALALSEAVADPTSAGYRHFLTPAQWEKRFSPTSASVNAVTSWLQSQGITVEEVTPDRMTVQASASASAIEHAFGTSLNEYRHLKKLVRLSATPLKVPAAIASLIVGVSGVDQDLATTAGLTDARVKPAKAKKGGRKDIPQPPGFRNPPPCSSSFGASSDTTDPPFGDGFPEPPPYAICGYTPAQLQGAYGLSTPISSGVDGKGVTVAVVDAYASPTLFSDAHHYSALNQPSQPLAAGQFSELVSKSFSDIEPCEASEWFGEQTLDIEAVHATAPGAHILYVGAKNCENALFKSVQQVVDGHLADIVTDSWGDDGGDLLDSAGTRHAFDDVLLMAGATGIGVQFSAGDEGDEFINFGVDVDGYPESSPFQTSVGGTSLEVGANDERVAEQGWSTSKSSLCTALLEEEPGCKPSKFGQWLPKAPGEYLYGGGGGTSYEYAEPSYQQGVVPTALAARNARITGIANRVEPDISMNGDPTTGMLVGETQEFPEGTFYDQYRIGGTSLSSPLFAGEMADADQAAGGPLGFVNPLLYALDRVPSGAFYDVVPGPPQDEVRVDFIDGVDANEGTTTSVRTLEYEGREEFCEETGHCSKQKVTLDTAPGFDSMTGLGTPGPGLLAAVAAAP